MKTAFALLLLLSGTAFSQVHINIQLWNSADTNALLLWWDNGCGKYAVQTNDPNRVEEPGSWGDYYRCEKNSDSTEGLHVIYPFSATNPPCTIFRILYMESTDPRDLTNCPNAPAWILIQPKSQAVYEFDPVSFTVQAIGSESFAYQWQRNNQNIAGATNSTYSIGSVSASQAGDYTVVVRGGNCITSSVAALAVNPAPVTITQGTASGTNGAVVLVPIKVRNFTNIVAFQFSMHWDSNKVQLLGVSNYGLSGYTANNINTTVPGTLTTSWDDPSFHGKNLAPDTALFAVSFKLIGEAGTSSSLWINGTPTALEFADNSLSLKEVRLIPGKININLPMPGM